MKRLTLFWKMIIYKLIQMMIHVLFRKNEKVALDQLLHTRTKILLAGFENEKQLNYLLSKGYENVINLSAGLTNGHSKHTYTFKDVKQVSQNNAEVIFLSDKAVKSFNKFSNYNHASKMVIEVDNIFALFSCYINFSKNKLLNRVDFAGTLEFSEVTFPGRHYMVISILKQKDIQTRKYISPIIGISRFFETLNNEGVNYVILRWFEELPFLKEGEDIDLLVSNEDASKLYDLLDEEIGIIPCDTYTVTGSKGFDYKNISYLTPKFAADILRTSTTHKEIFKVPDKDMHFYSMAYHTLYHKGFHSGIPSSLFTSVFNQPEHNYQKILDYLSKKANIGIDINMESLHALLESKKYSPPLDTLYRLSFENEWINKLIETKDESPISNKNVTVFVLREEAERLDLDDKLIQEIENEGFTVLLKKKLSKNDKEYFSDNTRGGNWGKGPFAHSGGKASTIVVTTDLMPQAVDLYTSVKYPGLHNKRIICKSRLRDFANSFVPEHKKCNMVHSSDNDYEAWYYISLILSQKDIRELLRSLNYTMREFETAEPVLKDLSGNGRRAKVEIVEYNGEKAVKKTFKPQASRFHMREVKALRSLNGKITELPEMITYGHNYIIYPYYEDKLKWKRGMFRLISIRQSKRLIEFLKNIYEEGYAFIDFYPMNVLYDKKQGLKVIDYEFFYKYHEKPEAFEHSYDIAGIPEDFNSDSPIQDDYGYTFNLLPYIGTDYHSLMNDPYFILQFKRARYFLTHKIHYSSQDFIISHLRNLKYTSFRKSKVIRKLIRLADSNMIRQLIK